MKSATTDRIQSVKAAYSAPRLATYGSVRNLTGGSGTANGDAGQNMKA